MSPPIRGAGTAAALKGALAGGVLGAVATDHAVFNSTQKRLGRGDFRRIPNGVNGIEERLHVVWHEMVVPGEWSMVAAARRPIWCKAPGAVALWASF